MIHYTLTLIQAKTWGKGDRVHRAPYMTTSLRFNTCHHTILGVIFVVLSLLNCLGQDENGGRLQNIVSGLVGAVIAGTLVYGAKTRNRLAILVWIVLAIIECILVCIFVAIMVIGKSTF